MRGDVRAAREVRGRCAGATAQAALQREGLSAGEVGARVRTSNMRSKLVTLDVSKVSGWLKFHASCRVARWVSDAGGGAGRGR